MATTQLQPFPFQDISTQRLFSGIERALGMTRAPSLGEVYTVDEQVLPETHFQIVEAVLKHLLGNDTRFSSNDLSTPDADQANRLARIYQSDAAYALCAQASGAALADLGPWHLHQFFARLAWLNDGALTSERAQSQLNQFVDESTPFWSAAPSLGGGIYSELGALFESVPEALRLWMVQFKRGARLVPVGEWVDLCSPQALYAGLAAQHAVSGSQAKSAAPDIVWAEVSWLFTPGQYHDKALLAVVDQQLPGPRAWTSMVLDLQAIPRALSPHAYLQVDLSTHISQATRAEFLRKVVTRAVHPDAAPWLNPAIEKARDAPGMRALSLAIKLHFEHPTLPFDQAIGLAALLLLPSLASSAAPVTSLPTSHAISTVVPILDSWCTYLNPDYLFQQMGIDVLCQPASRPRALRWTAHLTWQALVQTAQFQHTFAPLLRHMGYFPGTAGNPASPRITQALAGHAIVEYFLGKTRTWDEPLRDVLQGDWVCNHSHRQVREKVRDLIVARYPNASPASHDMLHYLLLREVMPELLVEGVPDHLQYGRSLQSVALIHSVALVEAMTPGASLMMPFNDLVQVSAGFAQATDAGAQAVWARTLAVPALRYASAHGEIAQAEGKGVTQARAATLGKALQFLKAQQELHAHELHALISLKAPDRTLIAQQMLGQAGIEQSLWDVPVNVEQWPILQRSGFTILPSYSLDRHLALFEKQATMLELIMMGEAYIVGQPTADEAYASAFETFRTALTKAESSVIYRLLCEMNPQDRAALESSTCELNRVRFGSEEGAQGLLIRCQQGDQLQHFTSHAVPERFFELIPASGVVREITQSFDYSVEASTWSRPVPITEAWARMERRREQVAQARLKPLIAMDSDAYLKGVASTSSIRLNAPLKGTLIPSSEHVYRAEATAQVRLEVLATACAKHLLSKTLEQSQVQHLHETDWEKTWAREREYADTAARWIIPFYGCVKDLAADDHSRGVVLGCALDVAFALIPMGQFVGSTAKIIMRAAELSVASLTRLTGEATARLVKGLLEQSAAMLARDLGKAGFGITRSIWAAIKDLPEIRQVFTPQVIAQTAFGLDRGVYRITDNLAHPWKPPLPLVDRRAVLDGQADVAVRNIGTQAEPDFRLLDPETGNVFGKKLTTLSAAEPVQLSRLSAADRIAQGYYPSVLPVALQDGVYEAGIADGCQVRVLDADEGVYTFLIDQQVYRLDTSRPDAALRKLAVAELSPRSGLLEQAESLCRVRRSLVAAPCRAGIRLRTPEPAPVPAVSTLPERTGKYPSEAMQARDFVLQKVTVNSGLAEQTLNVFVHEGKFCTWSGETVATLSEAQLAMLALPEAPVYKPELDGLLGPDAMLGLPANFDSADALAIHQDCPVVQLGAIAEGIDDARSLRGIRREVDGADWIFIEPDTGVFYKARTPQDQSTVLKFLTLSRADAVQAQEINEFIRLSEEYRLVRERSGVHQDRNNIARLLFDLLEPAERPAWGLYLFNKVKTYDDYVRWCSERGWENLLLKYATNILAGEEMQKAFVALAKKSMPDFCKIAQRSVPEQQHIVEVLNQLLPVQGSTSKWEALNLENVVKPRAARNILSQITGANLAFAQVYTAQGERIVYYSLSGGEKAKALALKLDVPGQIETRVDGVIYRDARARMASRDPDVTFTSLPVVRDADHLSVREFNRHLDSERLIATVLKEDMQGKGVTHIRVFSVLDTCRSCGGMVLPRLKADFPEAAFSVTYLKNYGGGAT